MSAEEMGQLCEEMDQLLERHRKEKKDFKGFIFFKQNEKTIF